MRRSNLETIEELTAFLKSTARDGARGRLRARGEARAITRDNGILPQGSPPFDPKIDTELEEYSFSLLRASMALKEAGGAPNEWRAGFVNAANGLESLVQNGRPDDSARGFNRVMGAAAYHMGGYSAQAYSLLSMGPMELNLAPIEKALVHLIIRNMAELTSHLRAWLLDPVNADVYLARGIELGTLEPHDVIACPSSDKSGLHAA